MNIIFEGIKSIDIVYILLEIDFLSLHYRWIRTGRVEI